MWTEAHRARHEAGLKNLLSLQAVGQIAAWLKRADPPRSGRATPSVAVVAGIWWHLRVGGPWRSLPPGYPPWRTVYGWFRRWQEAGLFDVLLRHVARRRRRARGRTKNPRLALIDTQSMKCVPVRGPRGYDAAKKVMGRKRVLLVDADGAVLAVAVLDGAFTAERCRDWCHQHGMRHRVVAREPGQRGFVVLERRWVVERSLGAFTHRGGLLRDRAGRLDISVARIACVALMAAVQAINNPNPVKEQPV